MGKNKEKKQKVRYYDDGSTISDMSGVGGVHGRREVFPEDKSSRSKRAASTFKDKMTTYFQAVRMMFLPMVVVLIVLTVVFLLTFILSGNAF